VKYILQQISRDIRTRRGVKRQHGQRKEVYLYQVFQGNEVGYEKAKKAGAFMERKDPDGSIYCIEKTFTAEEVNECQIEEGIAGASIYFVFFELLTVGV